MINHNNLYTDDMKIRQMILSALAGIPLMTIAAGGHGIERANLDENVKPGDDFYMYACGGWMKNNPLPGEFARFGTFDQLRENARNQLKDLILTLSETPEAKVKGTNAQKVSDLYSLGMDSVRLNKEGAEPLKPLLAAVEDYDLAQMGQFIAWLHSGIASGFFGTGVGTDQKDSNSNILHIGETGLGLGDRDYYLEDNETNRKIMDAYKKYIKTVMTLSGYSEKDADRIVNSVIEIETEMAKNKMTREQKRNPKARYNIMTVDEIKAKYPNIDWTTYFNDLKIGDLQKANISSLGYMEFINDYLPKLSERQIRDYAAFSIVSEAANLLSDDFYNANFEMYDRVMSGTEEQEPRWKRAMSIPNSMLGEAVGELYVNKYFPEESKKYMTTLVENLRVALGKHIDNLTWMSPETKEKAHEKLNTFTVKIGYPDKWKDYSEIIVDPSKSYMENVLEASKWYTADNYAKLNKAVDKAEWHMTPQTVNAYYNPTTNEICFPAGILQAPYFDVTADDALNYGAIGVVIGHEMTHGFDDQGRQFDKDGNLNDWWQEEDAKKFTGLADKLVEQFDAVEVAPGVHANGRFTLGENIADQGGLRVALTAYLDAMKDQKMEDIDGLTPLQRFYLAYANVWAANIRDEEVLSRTKSDPHSLGNNRVNVTLRNIEPFFEAFAIEEGQPMFRPESERVIIW